MKIDNISQSIPDDRDFSYVPTTRPLPKSLDLKPRVHEIEDQGAIGSCTCNSSVSALEMLKPASYSRLFAYWQTRNVVEDRAGQEGASLRDAIRSHYHYGVPLEMLWPYDPAQVNVRPGQDAYTDAFFRKVTRYEAIDCSNTGTSDAQDKIRAAIKSALNEGLPVVVATRVGKALYNLKGPWQTHSMPPVEYGVIRNGNTWIGNHATLIVGYDDSSKNFLVQNSWGADWGDGGFFGYQYWALGTDIMEAWVIRGFQDVLITPPAPLPTYIHDPAEVVRWYRKVWRTDVDETDSGVLYWANDPAAPRSFYGTWRDEVQKKCQELLDQLDQSVVTPPPTTTDDSTSRARGPSSTL